MRITKLFFLLLVAASTLLLSACDGDSTASSSDTSPPVITLSGENPLTIARGSAFTDPGTTVSDNVDTGLTATATGTVNTMVVGSYTITYAVSDASGNAATPVTRIVNVTDQTPPVIALSGATPLTIAHGSTFTDPGTTVNDNVDTGLTATATGTVNTTVVGSYTITYAVSDASGNVATPVTRTVNVLVFASVSLVDSSVLEGNAGAANLVFTVSLAAESTSDISVDYTASDGTARTASGDYTATTAVLTILAGATSATITVIVTGDTIYEPNETLTLTLSNPVNSTLANATATGTILNDDVGGINDTGITTWGNAAVNDLTVTQSLFPNQDADEGRDAQEVAGTLVKTGGGNSGFDFSKLNSNGGVIPASAANWDCVKDNVTGLTWEVKTTTASSLRNKNNLYTWYNSTGVNNGGNAGTAAATPSCATGGSCDTEKYVNALNALTGLSRICGFTDWRLPNTEELRSIVDYSIPFPGPAIDTTYFPNTSSFYWSSTPSSLSTTRTWGVAASSGRDGLGFKSHLNSVRLVRGGH